MARTVVTSTTLAFTSLAVSTFISSTVFVPFAFGEPPEETTPVKFFSETTSTHASAGAPTAISSVIAPAEMSAEQAGKRSYRLNEEGVEMVFQGRRDEGRKKILQALENDPQNATALYNLAGLELADSQPTEAIRHMEKALAIRPDDSAFLNRMAEAHFAKSDIPGAIGYLERLVSHDPGFGDAMSRLGALYGMAHDWEKAEATLRKAVALRPKDARTLRNFGNTLVLREKFKEAMEVLKQAQELSPAPENCVALGITAEALNQPEEALAYYRKAKSMGDKDQQISQHIRELEAKVAKSSSASK